MPSSRTNKLALEKKIRELQEREASNDGLSDSNSAFLAFLVEWRKHANTDPIIVIQPKGALTKRGQTIPAKIISVTDQTAADLFAFSRQRGQLVRLATDEEIAAYHDHVAAQQAAARGKSVAERTALARNQLASLLSVESVPFIEPAPADKGPGALMTAFEEPLDASGLKPSNLGDQTPAPAGTPAVERGVDELAGKKTAAKLAAGGFGTLDALAAATPEQLVALGIASKSAATLIADANAALAPTGEGEAA